MSISWLPAPVGPSPTTRPTTAATVRSPGIPSSLKRRPCSCIVIDNDDRSSGRNRQPMKVPFAGAIDCDLHPAMPGVPALLPYLDDYWRDQLVNRHIDKYSFVLTSYPPNSPLSARPDWRQASGAPAGDLDAIRSQALDPFGSRIAICNVLHGALALFNDDMAAALCSAVNDWTARELLDREPRLRASILVPAHDPALAV